MTEFRAAAVAKPPTGECPKCGQRHAAYALFPPACQYPGDPYTFFVDGKKS